MELNLALFHEKKKLENKMANINRVGSPMDLCDENYDQKQEKIERQKKFLATKQRTKSPFFIGSIEEVNKKISKLDRKLQHYTQLVVESRASDYDDMDTQSIASARGRDKSEKREKEARELNKFAGYFSMKQSFLPGRSERVRNISKVSLQPSKTTVVKKDSGKPKFVELYQYGGYDNTELTALPEDIPFKDMLKKAADAHMHLYKKPQYRPHFEKWFYSEMSQAVLSDLFWYLFLEKYQSSKNSQIKIFNRASHNFVKLLIYIKEPLYRDLFLKEYPCVMSQAIYAAFCHGFPDSYKHFGEQFKEDLIVLVYSWIAGITPAPRTWLSWNFDKLEPENIKLREEIAAANTQKNKKSSTNLNLDYLDSIFSSNASQYTSTTSLNQSLSKSSMQSYSKGRGRRLGRKPSISQSPISSKLRVQSAESSTDGTIIDYIAESQKLVGGTGSARKQGQGSGSKQRPVDARKLYEALTPIRETTMEEDHEMMTETKQSNVSVTLTKAHSRNPERKEKESHPACRGPDFVKTVFNITAKSPLVTHYFRMKNLEESGGQDILLQRTEMMNLPPLDEPTYKDVIRSSFKKVKDTEKQYDEFYEKCAKDNISTMKRIRAISKEHLRREKELLANPKEVKRICDLIMLDQINKSVPGQEKAAVRADTAIEAAIILDVKN